MRRFISVFAVAGMLAIGASPVAATAAGHGRIDLAGGNLDCGVHQYMFVSGGFNVVFHHDETPSGNVIDGATLTADKIVATDAAGNVYSMHGIFHFGGSFNANLDTGPFHFEAKIQVIGPNGGAVDSVNVVLAINPFGHEFDLDIGTCVPLG